MVKRLVLCIFAFGLYIVAFCGPCFSKVYLEVGRPEVKKRIGVLVMSIKGEESTSTKIQDLLVDCLGEVNFLSVKNQEFQGRLLLDEALLDREDYMSLGVDLIITGDVSCSEDGTFHLHLEMKDAFFGRRVYVRDFDNKDLFYLTYSAADSIVEHFTGERGLFSTKILFVARKKGKGVKQIYVTDFMGKRIRKVTSDGSIKLSPRWVDRGRMIYTSFLRGQPDLFFMSLPAGKPKPIFRRNAFRTGGDVSPDGRYLVFSSNLPGNPEIYLMDLRTGSVKRLTRNFAIDVSPRWSPDGRSIAFVSNRSGNPQIYVMDPSRKSIMRVTFQGKYNTTPCWSPKGDLIAFTGMFNGVMKICVVEPNGEDFRIVSQEGQSGEAPSFSPDGKYLSFVLTTSGRRLAIMDLQGNLIKVLTPWYMRVFEPSWSPFWF